MNKVREQGYYWVKTDNDSWHVAYWNIDLTKNYWTVCWHKFSVTDDEFLKINEERIIYDGKD